VLEGVLDRERTEYGHDHKEVVHGERFFQEIAGQEEGGVLGAVPGAYIDGETEGHDHPEGGPGGRVFEGYRLVFFMRVEIQQ